MGGSAHSPPTHGNAVERSSLLGLPIDSTQGESGAGTEGWAQTLQTTRQEDREGYCSVRQTRRTASMAGSDQKRQKRAKTRRYNHYFHRRSMKQASTHTHSHTHKSSRQTWKHLKCHLIAARNTHTVRELSRTLIFYTPTHSMVRIWACVCVSPSFTH